MEHWLTSLIWTCAMGLAVGNYATTWVYRVPRGESPFTRHPYCGGCGVALRVKDLFPAVSYLMLRGKCHHCAMPIPAVYWWTEILCALAFMWGFLTYGWTEIYLPVALGATVAIALWAIEWRSGTLPLNGLLFLASIGALYRTLLDGTLYGAAYGMIWGAMLPLILWRFHHQRTSPTANHLAIHIEKDDEKDEKKPVQNSEQNHAVPLSVFLGATAGVWFGSFGMVLFLPLWGIFTLFSRGVGRSYASFPHAASMVAFVPAWMLLVLNPHWLSITAHWALALLGDTAGFDVLPSSSPHP